MNPPYKIKSDNGNTYTVLTAARHGGDTLLKYETSDTVHFIVAWKLSQLENGNYTWEQQQYFEEDLDAAVDFMRARNPKLQAAKDLESTTVAGSEADTKKDTDRIYTKSLDAALESGEKELYFKNVSLNGKCVDFIHNIISLYTNEKNSFVTYEAAAKTVVDKYGFERVNWVLAGMISEHDGRYSPDNKAWARGFDIPNKNYFTAVNNTHPAILDGFISQVRKMYAEAQKQKEGGNYEPEEPDADARIARAKAEGIREGILEAITEAYNYGVSENTILKIRGSLPEQTVREHLKKVEFESQARGDKHDKEFLEGLRSGNLTF